MTIVRVFLLGATGYIGGPICSRLLGNGYAVTTLLRSDDRRAELLRQAGARVVIGDLDSVGLIEDESRDADIVITCASTSHLPSVVAILAGFRARRKDKRQTGVLIHTSGTGIFATGDARGLPPSPQDTSYSDLDVAAIEGLGDSHPQRKVHIKIVAAAEAGDVRSYIVLPSTIFGLSAEPGAGSIYNKHSSQMPALIRASLSRKRAGLVGLYENTWPLVHTDDLTDLYLLLIHAALRREDVGHGRSGYYVAANGQYICKDAALAIGRALYARGLAKMPEPSTFSAAELGRYFGENADFAGTNSQTTSERSRQLGWTPRGNMKAFLDSLDLEVESIWREEYKGKSREGLQ
ncbi:hypothetical protein BMF94_6728 [Rhodotorula taiwanensis]|uniref:NAD(P)-binding domain-containing protein n=1 Tax=Rhodotorula taiwanensis TaxID=741276 RepID=A0A2S5B061_9BASI|nr:hypothetical protein BMF94_6728 [Rhodotorula taiwanensis]